MVCNHRINNKINDEMLNVDDIPDLSFIARVSCCGFPVPSNTSHRLKMKFGGLFIEKKAFVAIELCAYL